jgi:hypothetical protein
VILTFNAAQFWVTLAVAIVLATLVTVRVNRVYAVRNQALRFGRVGTVLMLAVVWLAAFVVFGRLCLWAWA